MAISVKASLLYTYPKITVAIFLNVASNTPLPARFFFSPPTPPLFSLMWKRRLQRRGTVQNISTDVVLTHVCRMCVSKWCLNMDGYWFCGEGARWACSLRSIVALSEFETHQVKEGPTAYFHHKRSELTGGFSLWWRPKIPETQAAR